MYLTKINSIKNPIISDPKIIEIIIKAVAKKSSIKQWRSILFKMNITFTSLCNVVKIINNK